MTMQPTTTAPPDDIRALLNMSPTGRELLRGEFVLPFTRDEGDPTAESNVTDGRAQLWIDRGQIRLSVYSRTLGQWMTVGEERVGTIKMFAGAASDIEVGWVLCDGTNGTPNLLDKFILAGTFDEIGEENAGAATAIAAHDDHVLTIGNHVDDVTSANQSATDTVTDDGTNQKTVAIAHSHIVPLNLSHAGSSADAHSAHVVSTDYSPPSYKVAFIMKVA